MGCLRCNITIENTAQLFKSVEILEMNNLQRKPLNERLFWTTYHTPLFICETTHNPRGKSIIRDLIRGNDGKQALDEMHEGRLSLGSFIRVARKSAL